VVSLQDTRSEEARDGSSVPLFEPSKSAHAPKWLKRPAGVAFGFGGKLASFSAKGKGKVRIHQVVTDPLVSTTADRLHDILNNDRSTIESICRDRINNDNNNNNTDTWSIMGALFSEDQRKTILKQLGYDVNQPESEEKDTEEKEEGTILDNDKQDVEEEINTEDINTEISIPEDKDEAAISESVIIGNIEKAVDLCLSSNRMADALLLAAYAKNKSVWGRHRRHI